MEPDELLKFAVDNGIINLSYMQEQINMRKKEEILKKHTSLYSIWYSEKEDRWYSHLPDETKPGRRKKIKRKNKKDLENMIYEYYLFQEDNEKVPLKDTSIKTMFFEFMEHKKKEVGSGTIRRMMADWNKFYEPKQDFISKSVNSLTKIDVDDFFNSTLDKFQLKQKAFYNMCGLLKQTLEYCVDAEYIEKNPYRVKVNKKKMLSSYKKPSSKEVYQNNEIEIFIDEMERRFKNNPSNTAPLAILLDFELGTRKGEILALSKSDIVGNTIHIHRQLIKEYDITNLNDIKENGFKIVEYTKTEDGDRYLPLTPRALWLINRVIAVNEKYNFKCDDLLFVKDNHCMSPKAIDAQIEKGCKHINMPVKTMHKIRKTYASNLLHNGVNISIVKDLLGHADESTTLKHYIYNTEGNEETYRQVLNALKRENDASSDQSDQNNIVYFIKEKQPKPLKNKDSDCTKKMREMGLEPTRRCQH